MNSKGQVVFYTFMIAVIVIVVALAIAPVLNDFTGMARSETSDFGGMNCTSNILSDYDKGSCVILDLTSPFFILGLICVAGIILGAKVIFESM